MAALVAILVLLLLPSGRGASGGVVAAGDLEAQLERDLRDTAGTRVEAVDCPGESLRARDGAGVECALELPGGQTATAEVTFSDSAGSFTYEIPAGQFRQQGPGG